MTAEEIEQLKKLVALHSSHHRQLYDHHENILCQPHGLHSRGSHSLHSLVHHAQMSPAEDTPPLTSYPHGLKQLAALVHRFVAEHAQQQQLQQEGDPKYRRSGAELQEVCGSQAAAAAGGLPLGCIKGVAKRRNMRP